MTQSLETPDLLLSLIQALHAGIREAVVDSCRRSAVEELASVADDGPGDTIYAVDKVSEVLLIEAFERDAARLGGVVLIAEGIEGGKVVLPRGASEYAARYRVIFDPIDGTRCIMYQKRSAWILTGVADNHGASTRLSDVFLAVQTEIPTLKQHLADELWAVRGKGAQAQRRDLLTQQSQPLALRPSKAHGIEHGFAMICRFFPGGRDVLAQIDDEVMAAVSPACAPGKALCFEDQYTSTGGQFYELMIGHDRFNADLRPMLASLLSARGQPGGLCCHPYDVATALIAVEAGVLLTNPDGTPFDCLLDIDSDVAWVAYANHALRERIEPALQAALRRRGLLPP